MPTRGSKDPNGRALRGRRAHTTFALLTDPARQIWNSFNNRANAGGADAPEAAVNGCLYDRFKSLYNKTATKPSLVIVPARFKSGTLYSQIPSSNADFTVTRPLNTATRFDSSALIQTGITSGIPRLDYYTSGGVTGCPALLVEPAATNGILNSADTRTNWVLGANLTSGAIDVIGVSGNNLTVAVSGSFIGLTAGRIGRASNNVALASGSTYTISFFVKRTGTHTVGGYYAVITGAAGGDLGSGFDVSGSFSSGSIFASAGVTSRIRRVEPWGADVFRCSETFTMTASGTLTSFFLAPISGVTDQANPTVGSQLGFAAPQIELGSVPTSFIPTTTGTGSRSVDVISVSGAVSGSIGQTEGTFYLDLTYAGKGAATAPWIRIFGASNFIGLSIANSDFVRTNINNQSDILTTAPLTSAGLKIVFAYNSSGVVCFINGTQYTLTNGGGQTMSSITSIDTNLGVNPNAVNIRIRAMALYTTRLTNDELQSLTQT